MTETLKENLADIVSCSRRISESAGKEGGPDTASIKEDVKKLKDILSQFD